jgi:thermitase
MAWLGLGSVVAHANPSGHILVRPLSQGNISNLCNSYATCVCASTPSGSVYALTTPTGTTDAAFAQLVNADPRVSYAVTDMTICAPEFSATQFNLAFDASGSPGNYTSQYAFQQVNIGRVWRRTTGAGVIVAVLDTGATFSHPALQGHYLRGYNTINHSLPPNDVADVSPPVAVGHGTMIAGIIAQVAPGAMIMPIRVLDSSGTGTLLNLLSGIDYAIANGAQVINLSLGSAQGSQALGAAMRDAYQAGVLVVAAAGNNAADQVDHPASNPYVLAVTSVDSNNLLASFANYGPKIAVVAPGINIRSAYINNGYASWSGTSFSVPFVCAEAALLFSDNPCLENSDVSNIICDTANTINWLNPGLAGLLGNGLINIQAAVNND